eukprot:gene33339-40329_t
MEVFDHLNQWAGLPDLSPFFLPHQRLQDLYALLRDLEQALTLLLDSSSNLDLTAPNIAAFIQTSLPIVAEFLLRRKSSREQEGAIANSLEHIVEFLSTPLAHDVLELCELRNMILMNIIPHHYVFINPKQVSTVPTAAYQYASSQGFYSEHGKPNYALIGSKVLAFWPDEWKTLLGESKAIGHYLQYYTTEGQWVEGKVTAYEKKSNTYLLEVKGLWNADTEQFVEVGGEQRMHADLESRPHHWSDISNQQSILGKGAKLKYHSSDVSKFIRVWWSRYQRFYYGRVVAYDTAAKLHTIMYEDNDSRAYDMNTKEYELIDPPLDLLKSVNGVSDAHAAKLV